MVTVLFGVPLTAIQYLWKFLTSAKAGTNSSQPSFGKDGCISLFSCQRHLRNLVSRLLKFGLAKSFSIEISVSSTVMVYHLIIVQTTPLGCYMQHLIWESRSSISSHCSLHRTGSRQVNRVLPVFHFLKLVRIFYSTLKHIFIFADIEWRTRSLLFSNQ